MKSSKVNKLLTFSYAVLSGFKINFVGQLGANEILALIATFSVKRIWQLFRDCPDIKKVNVAYGIFLISQIVSDIVNDSPLTNMFRGTANIVMAIIVTNFLATMLQKNSINIINYLVGTVITTLLFGELDTESISFQDMGFFKFQLAPALNSALIISSWYFQRKRPKSSFQIAGIFLLYGLFNIALDFRSNGLIFILVSILYYKRATFIRITNGRLASYVIAFSIIFQFAYTLYVSQALSGKIGGEHTKNQFTRISNPYNPLALLMTGRAEVYSGMMAALDKPIFGHGSWPIDKTGKYQYMVFNLHDEAEKFDDRFGTDSKRSIIPSHSVIIGAWMSSGVIGGLAMIWLLAIFYRNTFQLLKNPRFSSSPFYSILILYSLLFIWNFLFSPLNHIKQTLPIMIAFSLVMNAKFKLDNKKVQIVNNKLAHKETVT